VVMYELLTGRLPFIGTSASELATMHRETVPTPPKVLNQDIPDTLNQILLKVLQKEPSARYRTADQLGRVLLTITNPSSFTSPAVSFPDAPTIGSVPYPSSQTQDGFNESPSLKREVQPKPVETPSRPDNPLDIDWGTWALGLLALLAVGGLIPFWLWVYLVYNPPMP
jgi:eukaryotic-like serine/threonine-protein kinase